ncbi:hypothetical protein BLOT_009067 [Blomia tropicalis]|nr:hypothetical protein BLOT_009067 [Blomia tropicalis]
MGKRIRRNKGNKSIKTADQPLSNDSPAEFTYAQILTRGLVNSSETTSKNENKNLSAIDIVEIEQISNVDANIIENEQTLAIDESQSIFVSTLNPDAAEFVPSRTDVNDDDLNYNDILVESFSPSTNDMLYSYFVSNQIPELVMYPNQNLMMISSTSPEYYYQYTNFNCPSLIGYQPLSMDDNQRSINYAP